MGKRARDIRSAVKGFARKLGYKETELGELKAVVTKAEARRRFLDWKWKLSFLFVESIREMRAFYEANKIDIQCDIIDSMSRRIAEETDCSVIDAEILAGIV